MRTKLQQALTRWWPSAAFTVAALWLFATFASDGSTLVGVVTASALLAAAWWVYPLRGRGSLTYAEARALVSANQAVVVFWRPGCLYCQRMRSRLRGLGAVRWVNVWSDSAARDFVRAHNDGNEVVPTVLTPSGVWTNPDPARVRAEVSQASS